jgi:arylsulfatase A-like enzyme
LSSVGATPGETPPGIAATLRSGIVAGLACGALFGLVDAIVAAWIGTADLGVGSFVGCAAGAVFQYALVWTAGLIVAAIALHPMLVRKAVGERAVALLRVGLMLGLFLELYWWSRPFVFYGWNSLGAPRLLATVAIAAVAFAIASVVARPFQRRVLARPGAVVSVVVVVALGGLAYVLVRGGGIGDRGKLDERNGRVPNVLLVVVDAMRRDTLGCYGSERVKSPCIDELAREGVVFENAFTQAPFTWTSFGSLLTGKYPRRHGLVQMAPGYRLPPNITLALHLKSACFEGGAAKGTCLQDGDYLGATFHTGTLSTGSGLLRGFDVYYEQMAGHGIVLADSAWSVFRSDLLLHIIAAKAGAKVGNDTAGTAKRWFDAHSDRRFVAMVHLYSTHTPYDPPKELREKYCDPKYAGPIQTFYAPVREAIEAGRFVPTEADVEQIRNLYYAGVGEADAKVGMLLDDLRAHGVLDDTLVIVTADHGESLGEPGLGDASLWEHDHMVQTNLRVPLVMRWPKRLPAGVRVKAITDEIDVVPTVCDLLGVGVPHEDGSFGVVDGKSVLPLVRGEVDRVRAYSFAENGLFAAAQDEKWKLVLPDVLAEAAGTVPSETDVAAHAWLVDLAADPGEVHNVAAAHPEEVRRLAGALHAWSESMPIRKADEVLSARERERQRNMLNGTGYGGSGQYPGQSPK